MYFVLNREPSSKRTVKWYVIVREDGTGDFLNDKFKKINANPHDTASLVARYRRDDRYHVMKMGDDLEV